MDYLILQVFLKGLKDIVKSSRELSNIPCAWFGMVPPGSYWGSSKYEAYGHDHPFRDESDG
jgi:hypothetical protein